MEKHKIRPGKWLYGLAAGIALIGILIVVGTSLSAVKQSKNYKRMVAPGVQDFYLEDEGVYMIYHEFKSNFEGEYFYSNNLSGLKFRIENIDTHEEIRVTPNIMNSTYQFGEREGRLHSKFSIKSPGTYRISINLDRNSGKTIFAIGKGNMGLSIFFVTLSIFVLVFCLLATKAIIIITFVSRRKKLKGI